eukprot:CAMPEP_0174307196 /NCGR_PEP_ID=MMETSP0810-20121108/961_1 /TAXON_ID=73025 ORGANISM="Eutreptiella gymnastica-like, Strain CCMP1594" /NCGR_SAMPLE_ID=MMETSP0810 /ASSEMBLY_ACC=CAM_ASM_000659 /LENGTH=709 /DNA_ID=CAMNT_0015414173 /DNA_START=69 /DNA_END=2198 /DNA_ORIENTATION=-
MPMPSPLSTSAYHYPPSVGAMPPPPGSVVPVGSMMQPVSYHNAYPPPSRSYLDAPRPRSRSLDPPTYRSIRSMSPVHHASTHRDIKSSGAERGTLNVRLTKGTHFIEKNINANMLDVEVTVGGESHDIEFPEPYLAWDHTFQFRPVILDRDGLMVCVDHLVITVWEGQSLDRNKSEIRDRAKLDLTHLTQGHPSVFMIELGGYSGISLEAIAEDFGEPQYRSRNRGDRDQDRDRANSDPIDGPTTGIGKLKIAMLRQLGFPTGKQILIELIVGSKKIQTNMGSTNREQLGDKFTFFVKLRDTPVQGLQIACAPLQLRVLEKGSILLGTGNLDLNELRELQISRHKVEIRNEQDKEVGRVEVALKPMNFGRRSPKGKGLVATIKANSGGTPREQDRGQAGKELDELRAQLNEMQARHANSEGTESNTAYQLKLKMVNAELDRAQVELDRLLAGDAVVLDQFGDGTGREFESGSRYSRSRSAGSSRHSFDSTAIGTAGDSFDDVPPGAVIPHQRTGHHLGRPPRAAGQRVWRSSSAGPRSGSPALSYMSDGNASDGGSPHGHRIKTNRESVEAVERFFGLRRPVPRRPRAGRPGRNPSPRLNAPQGPSSFARPMVPYTTTSLALPVAPAQLTPLVTTSGISPKAMQSQSYLIDPKTGERVNSLEDITVEQIVTQVDAPHVPETVVTYYRDPETRQEVTAAELNAKYAFVLE